MKSSQSSARDPQDTQATTQRLSIRGHLRRRHRLFIRAIPQLHRTSPIPMTIWVQTLPKEERVNELAEHKAPSRTGRKFRVAWAQVVIAVRAELLNHTVYLSSMIICRSINMMWARQWLITTIVFFHRGLTSDLTKRGPKVKRCRSIWEQMHKRIRCVIVNVKMKRRKKFSLPILL